MNKKRLGRGLDALLGRDEGGFEPSSWETSTDLAQISIEMIDTNPYQPRRYFDESEIKALSESLIQHGMLQPVIVRAIGDRFQLIAGERRFRAAKVAMLHEIPARIMDLDDQRVCEIAMVENLQREDLGAIDKAVAFRAYLDQFSVTQEELAEKLGLERSTISNFIRLLDLPEEVRKALSTKAISMGHARALLALDGSEAQIASMQRVIDESLSVRQTEALVSTGEPTPAKSRPKKSDSESVQDEPVERPEHVIQFEKAFHERLGMLVQVKLKKGEAGQIIIPFKSIDEWDKLNALLQSMAG
ncbi:MAG: ParB/RepB/Spo0J family partition protein [Planctomycetota bacterium]